MRSGLFNIFKTSWFYIAILLWIQSSSCKFDLPAEMGGDASSPSEEAAPPQQFVSCLGLASICGPAQTASCCQTVVIPAGSFYREYDTAPDVYNDMNYPATISAFALDKFEVTVGRFRAFVNAGKGVQSSPPPRGAGAHPKLSDSGWDDRWNANLVNNMQNFMEILKCGPYQNWTDVPGMNEDKAMNCINWYEAMAFCIWDGGCLPTEVEWHYAASGGGEQRAYPWSYPPDSTIIDCGHANYHPPATNCVSTGSSQVGSTSPGGDGRWGNSDLSANMWEWVLDWFVRDYYPVPCDVCSTLRFYATSCERRQFLR